MKNTCRLAIVAFLYVLAAVTGRSQVFVDLTFSGGDGSPLSMTLNTPLHFELSGSIANPDSYLSAIPFLVFKGAGNLVGTRGLTGSIPLSINGTLVTPFPPGTFNDFDPATTWLMANPEGAAGTLNQDDLLLTSGYFLLSTTPIDPYPDMLTSLGKPDLYSGGYFDMGTGTLTSLSSFTTTTPAISGRYEVIVIDLTGEAYSGITVSVGASVPEPSAYAALAGLAALGATIVIRRRKQS